MVCVCLCVCLCVRVCVFMISHLFFLSADLRMCQAVSFGQHWNYVDFFMQGLHKLHIQRSKTDGRGTQTCVCVCVCEHKHIEKLHRECCTSLSSCAVFCMLSVVPVAKRRDEVEAAVDSVVLDVPPVQPALISEVLLKLLVDVVFYFLPAIANM